jgi:hypothetical protein
VSHAAAQDQKKERRHMTKLNQNGNVPPGAPAVTHNSGNIRSTPAGGEVSRNQYHQPAPTPPPAPTLEPRR